MTRLSTSDIGRVARRFWPGTGGLARPVDWVESGVLVSVVLLGLLAVPVSAAVGSESYWATAQAAEQVAAPSLDNGGAVAAGVITATVVLAVALSSLALLFHAVRWVLDRRRARRWDMEWVRVGADWK